jgi:large subunit ribosomal protein L9
MRIILKETIESLGIIGSEVDVADGYARNFLFPQNKAVKATPQNHRMLEQEKAKFDLQIAKEKSMAEEMAQRLEGVECTVKARTADDGRLYGSVTVRDIVDALAKQDVEVERRIVLLKEPLKEVGTYKVPIRVYRDVEPEITVYVEPEEETA